MDKMSTKHKDLYDRVMPRVQSKTSVKSKPSVTRHESCLRVGAKSSTNNSRVCSELPTVLNDYKPDDQENPRKITYVAKPKRTLQSLDPKKSPIQLKNIRICSKLHSRASAPTVLNLDSVNQSASNVRQCYSSRSHTRLKELQKEIKAFEQIEKSKGFRDRLYKSCGVLLDEGGKVAEDKAVQAEGIDTGPPER